MTVLSEKLNWLYFHHLQSKMPELRHTGIIKVYSTGTNVGDKGHE